MKERKPDFEDEKMRAWMRKPKEEDWEELGEDPTVMTIEEETEEIFESRTYRLLPTPEAYLLALDVLHARMGQRMLRMPPDECYHECGTTSNCAGSAHGPHLSAGPAVPTHATSPTGSAAGKAATQVAASPWLSLWEWE
jgi:hypothetical protein